MQNIQVMLITKPDFDPASFIGGLAQLTQVSRTFEQSSHTHGINIIKAIHAMGHTSLLECADFGFIIQGASRRFLAQITRHRQASFTSKSQQYIAHKKFKYFTPPELDGNLQYVDFMLHSADLYEKLLSQYGKDVAAYVLPNAARNDLYMKINLRELMCVIIPQRLCKRNTPETIHVLRLMLRELEEYKEIIELAGCACVHGVCDQGRMSCNKPYTSWAEMANG